MLTEQRVWVLLEQYKNEVERILIELLLVNIFIITTNDKLLTIQNDSYICLILYQPSYTEDPVVGLLMTKREREDEKADG